MRKLITVAAITAAMAVIGATSAFAADVDKVEVQGVRFEIPEDIRDLVTVQTEGLGDKELVKVSETGSIEAAKANGGDADSAGWLFTIGTLSEEEMEDARCKGACDGMAFFGVDDDCYYVYYHPTDVRFERETPEKMKEDHEIWSKVNEWANGTVRDEIVKNNEDMDPFHCSCTNLDINICKIAYGRDVNFEIHSVAYPDLDASKYPDNKDYALDLVEEVVYKFTDEPKDTSGEYYVLSFPDQKVRYDFFLNPELENVVREVFLTDAGDEDSVYYYEATFDYPEYYTATSVMEEWIEEIANPDADDADDVDDADDELDD